MKYVKKDFKGKIKLPLNDFRESSDWKYEAYWAGNHPSVVVYRPRWRKVWGYRVFYGNWKIPIHEEKPQYSFEEAKEKVVKFVDDMEPEYYNVGIGITKIVEEIDEK